jgi:integrase
VAHIRRRLTASGEARYHVRWRLTSGRAQEKVFKRRGDAENYRRKIEGDELLGVVTDYRGADTLFGVYSEEWTASRLIRGRPLAASTMQGYRGLLRRNLLPIFEETPLQQMTTEAIRAWYAATTGNASQDQAAKSYRLLRAILNTAVDDKKLATNPCRIKGGGSENAKERPMLTRELVLALAEAIGDRYRAVVWLAGFGGLRTGEMLGLTRADVDILHGQVLVREQAQEIVGLGRVVGAPKTVAGKRPVAIPKSVAEVLDNHLATFAQPGPNGAVFTGPGGTPLRRATLSEEWRGAVAAVGAPEGLHVHDLRHHAATTMARMPGLTTKELMARIGHASPAAALRYQHATAERDRRVADWLEDQISSPESAPQTGTQNEPRAARGIKTARKTRNKGSDAS